MTVKFEIVIVTISIHALRGEGDSLKTRSSCRSLQISIHALRGEGDEHGRRYAQLSSISIHALRGEGDIYV